MMRWNRMNAVMIHVAHDGTNDLCRFRPMKIAGTDITITIITHIFIGTGLVSYLPADKINSV